MPKAASRTASATQRQAPYSKPTAADKENINPSASSDAAPSQNRGNYLDIPLPEIDGEVPCYEDAAAVRRKLKKLLTDKAKIPGTSKTFTQVALADEMRKLKEACPYEIETANKNGGGPSTRALSAFLSKKGSMGGGDSEVYYWGTVLLEKLRIWNGEKKTKGRIEAEKEFPEGHKRWDPSTVRLICGPGLPMPSIAQLAKQGRGGY